MSNEKNYSNVELLVVGAGPAGLAAAIAAKRKNPAMEVCVVDKGSFAGSHNLSGAALEPEAVEELLDMALPDWRESDEAKKVLGRVIDKDDVLFSANSWAAFNIRWKIKIAGMLGLCFGQMDHKGDYIVSVSELTAWLCDIAEGLGVEVLFGFAVEDIVEAEAGEGRSFAGVKLVDQGLDEEGERQPNYLEGEVVRADIIILAEGCDGLVTEKFIAKAGLEREHCQLYSLGVKEVIKVSDEQYEKFTDGRAVHALGWPLWRPVMGPGIFGGGVMYSMGDNKIAVGMIAALDWKYNDFNVQDALARFKEHRRVSRYIEGGVVVEAGAKMIPEGGYYSLPRDEASGAIGRGNVLIVGDSAGFVNMLKIKGLHNAIDSGRMAGIAAAEHIDAPLAAARVYTRLVDGSRVMAELKSAKHFRHTIGKFGMLMGMPLSVLNGLLPMFRVEEDYKVMKQAGYPLKCGRNFDKDTFTAMARTDHREDQPSHLTIVDPRVCVEECVGKFDAPCITFCPAGVYETVGSEVKPANPLNCLHCKTCQRKCPFDNIRWTVPEGGGGPCYRGM